jgi:hypothetical protein
VIGGALGVNTGDSADGRFAVADLAAVRVMQTAVGTGVGARERSARGSGGSGGRLAVADLAVGGGIVQTAVRA